MGSSGGATPIFKITIHCKVELDRDVVENHEVHGPPSRSWMPEG
jgi:hypothetical protein